MADGENSRRAESGDFAHPRIVSKAIAGVEGANAGMGGSLDQAAATADSIAYAQICQTNDGYDGEYWNQLDALYEGGRRLLRDRAMLERIFPRHRGESDAIYSERTKRALYIPYAAEILDYIVAQLTAEPLRLHLDEDQEIPPFYAEFVKDVSPPGGERLDISALIKRQILRALICRTAWTLVDLPSMPRDMNGASIFSDLASQEKSGALNAYVICIDPISVIDWEEDEAGELEWVVVHTRESKRRGLQGNRNAITERWMYYTRGTWELYEISYPKDKPPTEKTPVPLVRAGVHTFGRVPLDRLTLPSGLWAMNKLENLAREHFNKRSALSWAEFQSLFQELYEFLAPEEAGKGATIGENQQDASRALNQRRGQGFIQQRGSQDRAEFVGPDSGPFAHAMASCDNIRDEMHRVTHQMALTVDNSAAALGRSGESKGQDKAATCVVLQALGQVGRDHAEKILRMVSSVRGEEDLVTKWHAKGMDEFDDADVGGLVEEAVSLETVSIKSPTFHRKHQAKLAKVILGEELDEDDIKQIEKELDENITDEEFDPEAIAAKEAEERDALLAAKGPPGGNVRPTNKPKGGSAPPSGGKP